MLFFRQNVILSKFENDQIRNRKLINYKEIMMKLAICMFGVIFLLSCKQNDTKSKSSTIPVLELGRFHKVVSPEYVILKYNSTKHWFFKDSKAAELNLSEVKEIEMLLSKCINAYNSEQLKIFEKDTKEKIGYKISKSQYIIDLKRYDRQFVPVINKKGEKEIWVNCFCGTHSDDWKTNIVGVDDGGNCYFNLKINLTKKTYYDFGVNGEA